MRTRHRLALAVLTLLAGMVALAAPASALASIDSVATALRSSPLYNDPAAETALTESQAADLLAEIDRAGTPIYIAVVPQSFVADNGGTARAALTNLANAVGRDGTYALVAGRSFWASSNVVSGTGAIASQAIASNSGGGAYDVLSAFVTGVSEKAASGGSSASGGSGSRSDEGGFPWGWVLVGGAAAGIGGSLYYSRRKSTMAQAAQLESLRKVVDEDVTSFGERVVAIDANDPRLGDEGRADLQAALESYRAASDGSMRIKASSDAAAVTSHLDDGRFQMARVDARLGGDPLPERRPPCFFDPRHGMSATDVGWSPPGGAERSVPVCAACAGTVLRGATPASREVPVGAESRPYWNAGPMYGGYAGGYFSSFGSILPSIMIGTMLGNALFPPMMGGMGSGIDQAGIGGMGDLGGGSFGGGDFGGGDFGGGDFGGGDF